jgi:abortive infection bacteriophage resistance protein
MEFKNIKTLELYFLDILNTRSINILEKIADDYGLNKEELLYKYTESNKDTVIGCDKLVNQEEINIKNSKITDEIVKTNKKISIELIDDNFRCIAMTRMNTRCKRSKRNTDYCNIHLKKINIII